MDNPHQTALADSIDPPCNRTLSFIVYDTLEYCYFEINITYPYRARNRRHNVNNTLTPSTCRLPFFEIHCSYCRPYIQKFKGRRTEASMELRQPGLSQSSHSYMYSIRPNSPHLPFNGANLRDPRHVRDHRSETCIHIRNTPQMPQSRCLSRGSCP